MLIKSATIDEMAAHRDRALDCFARMQSARSDYEAAISRALDCKGPSIGFEIDYQRHDDLRSCVDRAAWRAVLRKSGMDKLMGAKQLKEFTSSLEKDPPEFTADNIRLTFQQYADNPRAVFDQSIVDLFERLPPAYKSNDAYKFGARIVINYAVNPVGSWQGWRDYGYGTCPRDHIRDLDRIFLILDGKTPPGTFVENCASAMSARQYTYTGDYMRAKWFKNGNMHLHLLRDDLVQKINHILAAHYGQALGDAR